MLQKSKMEEINKKVSLLLKDCDYNEQVDEWIDVVRVARRNGFVVGNARLPVGDQGFIVIQPDRTKLTRFGPMVIGVNSELDKRTKRFVIGHELGHWQLHHVEGKLYRHQDGDWKRNQEEKQREEEADYFAAALLMPTESFRRHRDELKELGLPRSKLSIRLMQAYDVPLESVLRREEELEILLN